MKARRRAGYLVDHIKRDKTWRLIDCKGQRFGPVVNQIAWLLMGKHKPTYMPGEDNADYVVVINAKHLEFADKRRYYKTYFYHTGRLGGGKSRSYEYMLEKGGSSFKKPLLRAIKNSLPNTEHQRKLMMTERLFIYPEELHPKGKFRPVLAPPAAQGKFFARGGAPTDEQMENMWSRTVSRLPIELVEETIAEVRAELTQEEDALSAEEAQARKEARQRQKVPGSEYLVNVPERRKQGLAQLLEDLRKSPLGKDLKTYGHELEGIVTRPLVTVLPMSHKKPLSGR